MIVFLSSTKYSPVCKVVYIVGWVQMSSGGFSLYWHTTENCVYLLDVTNSEWHDIYYCENPQGLGWVAEV